MTDAADLVTCAIIPPNLWECDWFADERFTEREAYLWICDRASRSEVVEVDGDGGPVEVPSPMGQVVASITDLSDEFRWPIDEVKTFLSVLTFHRLINTATRMTHVVITMLMDGQE